jgi:hypothetical protein
MLGIFFATSSVHKKCSYICRESVKIVESVMSFKQFMRKTSYRFYENDEKIAKKRFSGTKIAPLGKKSRFFKT